MKSNDNFEQKKEHFIRSPFKENESTFNQPIKGFSKLSKLSKIDKITEQYFDSPEIAKNELIKYWHKDEKTQKTIDEFSENTLSNFLFPFGVVPNVKINNKILCVPMVIEESSVVAASAKAANFWLNRGGFKVEVLGVKKIGQVHFIWNGDSNKLASFFNEKKSILLESIEGLNANMKKRGGGLLDLKLIDRTQDELGYYQLFGEFDTCDAMGANFINSLLETLGRTWKDLILAEESFLENERDVQIILCILSNYTPECLVKATVDCSLEELEDPSLEMSAEEFASKFARAIRISKIDVTRATTHNKGIFNGIDAVVIATGNDFRAVEACGHTYAARDGQYRGLSNVEIKDGRFIFSLELPLSVGSIGGLTALHPMAKFSLQLLGNPGAQDLMKIIATIGLAQNFAAVRSLVTSGIQKGHMKMHLMNILNHLEACEVEREKAKLHFENEIITFKSVREFIASLRNYI
jgi:hydroxymethylglutaryl-CoA reductase